MSLWASFIRRACSISALKEDHLPEPVGGRLNHMQTQSEGAGALMDELRARGLSFTGVLKSQGHLETGESALT